MIEYPIQKRHLRNLIEQKSEVREKLLSTEKLYWKIEGAIEYLEGIGVNLSEGSADQSESVTP